jgi:hypothetical protein
LRAMPLLSPVEILTLDPAWFIGGRSPHNFPKSKPLVGNDSVGASIFDKYETAS